MGIKMLLVILSTALAYEPTKDITFSKYIEKKILKINNDSLNYSFHRRERSVYPGELVERAISVSSSASLKKIKEIAPNIESCRPNEYLEIYEISLSQLNDQKRFSLDFFNQQGIWGYFDPRIDEPQINSILLTPHSLFENFQILTHEVAHHWYSAYCLERHTYLTSEEFATHIQFSLENLNVYN